LFLESSVSKRILVSLIGIPAIIAFIESGPIALCFALFVISGFILRELISLLSISSSLYTNLIYLLSIVIVYFAYQQELIIISITGLAAIITVVGVIIYNWKITFKSMNQLGRWILITGIAIFLFYSISHIILIALLGEGIKWLYLIIFSVFSSDSGAYFIGKMFGKNKMVPQISPNKTWEGAIGGMIFCLAATILISTYFDLPINITNQIVLGFIISILAQIGDITESALKRLSGVKDSGTVLPGHGGFLDRIDSFIFVLPVTYYWIIII
jgi:phosphatidate cytidylyltransferase